MAASDVEICNLGLSKLGDSRIASLADNTKPARAMNAVYRIVRDKLLRTYLWNFAIKRASLPALTSTPTHGFAREFQLPSDCLRLVFVGDYFVAGPRLADYVTGEDVPYAVEGRKILTDLAAPLKIRYVRRVDDPSEYDASFDVLLAHDLALAVAETLTASETKKQSVKADRRDALQDAIRANSIEKPPVALPDDTWVLARL